MEADGTCFSTGFSLNFVAKLILQLPRSARSVGSRSSGKRLEGGRMKLQGEARSPLGFKNRLKLRQDVARIKRSASRMRAARNREEVPSLLPFGEKGIDTTVAKQQQQQQQQQEERGEGKPATYGLSVKKSFHCMAALVYTRDAFVFTRLGHFSRRKLGGVCPGRIAWGGWREASRMGT